MFTWEVSKMQLLGTKDQSGNYAVESITDINDKINFVDCMQDGKLGSIIKTVKKYNNEAADLKRDTNGIIKSVSMKAWIKRSTQPGMFTWSGKASLLGCDFCLGMRKGISMEELHDFVDRVFHKQLEMCEQEEFTYSLQRDSHFQMTERVYEGWKTRGTAFGADLSFTIRHGGPSGSAMLPSISVNGEDGKSRPITYSELKLLSDEYDRLDAYIGEHKVMISF